MGLGQIKVAKTYIIQEFEDNKLRKVINALEPASQDYDSPRYSKNHYIESYPSLCKVTQFLCEQVDNRNVSLEDAVLSIAHIAYGWMPTILENCNINCQIVREDGRTILDARYVASFNKAVQFINGYQKSPINNSWIGLSKVLHFIKPEFFPIWDSNVARNFNLQRDYAWTNDRSRYTYYIQWCHSVLDPKEKSGNAIIWKAVEEVRELFSFHVGYEVSRIRALEFILFVLGRQQG